MYFFLIDIKIVRNSSFDGGWKGDVYGWWYGGVYGIFVF